METLGQTILTSPSMTQLQDIPFHSSPITDALWELSRNDDSQTGSSALDHNPSKTHSAQSTAPSLPSETFTSSASLACSQATSDTLLLSSAPTDNAHVHVTVSIANPFLALANGERADGDNAELTAYNHEGRPVLVPTELRRHVNLDSETGKNCFLKTVIRKKPTRISTPNTTLSNCCPKSLSLIRQPCL